MIESLPIKLSADDCADVAFFLRVAAAQMRDCALRAECLADFGPPDGEALPDKRRFGEALAARVDDISSSFGAQASLAESLARRFEAPSGSGVTVAG